MFLAHWPARMPRSAAATSPLSPDPPNSPPSRDPPGSPTCPRRPRRRYVAGMSPRWPIVLTPRFAGRAWSCRAHSSVGSPASIRSAAAQLQASERSRGEQGTGALWAKQSARQNGAPFWILYRFGPSNTAHSAQQRLTRDSRVHPDPKQTNQGHSGALGKPLRTTRKPMFFNGLRDHSTPRAPGIPFAMGELS